MLLSVVSIYYCTWPTRLHHFLQQPVGSRSSRMWGSIVTTDCFWKGGFCVSILADTQTYTHVWSILCSHINCTKTTEQKNMPTEVSGHARRCVLSFQYKKLDLWNDRPSILPVFSYCYIFQTIWICNIRKWVNMWNFKLITCQLLCINDFHFPQDQ